MFKKKLVMVVGEALKHRGTSKWEVASEIDAITKKSYRTTRTDYELGLISPRYTFY